MAMTETPSDHWISEDELISATGIGRYNLVRWRQQGLIPKPIRRNLGFGVGTASSYPPIAIPMIRRLNELRQHVRDVDAWHWALWLDGYPIDITKWASERLVRAVKTVSSVKNREDLRKPIWTAAATPAAKTSPHRPLFRSLQARDRRRTLLSWAVAIGTGIEPAMSIYEPNSDALGALRKAVGLESTQTPDPDTELEQMSLDRLRDILNGTTAAEMDQARRDCKALTELAEIAEGVDWHRTRAALKLPRQGASNIPLAPFERLFSLWRSFDVRAAILPFMIFLRRSPDYSRELDERFASAALELRCLANPPAEEADAAPRK